MSVAHVVTISNRKGGAAKTTTTLGLAGGLRLHGYKVLMVDLDGQRNLTYTIQAETTELSVYDVLKGDVSASEAICRTEQGDILTAADALELLDIEFTGKSSAYSLLRDALKPVKGKYDYIIIDTPPALGLAAINALHAADGVVIPLQADLYSLKALDQMHKIIDGIRRQGNRKLRIYGLLLTRFNQRTNLDRAVLDAFKNAAKGLKTRMFETYIREGVAIREAAVRHKDMFNSKSKPAADYSAWVEEFLRVTEEG